MYVYILLLSSFLSLIRFESSLRRSTEQMISSFSQRLNTKWSSTRNRSAPLLVNVALLYLFILTGENAELLSCTRVSYKTIYICNVK